MAQEQEIDNIGIGSLFITMKCDLEPEHAKRFVQEGRCVVINGDNTCGTSANGGIILGRIEHYNEPNALCTVLVRGVVELPIDPDIQVDSLYYPSLGAYVRHSGLGYVSFSSFIGRGIVLSIKDNKVTVLL